MIHTNGTRRLLRNTEMERRKLRIMYIYFLDFYSNKFVFLCFVGLHVFFFSVDGNKDVRKLKSPLKGA